MIKRFTLLTALLLCAVLITACGVKPTDSIIVETGDVQPPSGNATNEVIELINRSYSTKDFVEGDVSEEAIQQLLQCGLKAPSAKNAQPWHFTVSTNDEINRELLDDAQKGNCVVVISGNPNIVTDTLAFDCGLAAQNIQLAAESLGYGCRMYLSPLQQLDKEYRDVLAIPKDYKIMIALLIGPVDNPSMPPPLPHRETPWKKWQRESARLSIGDESI